MTLAGACWTLLLAAGAAAGQPPTLVPQAAHADKVRSLAFSPDGRVLASASSDRRVKLWEVSTGALLRTLGGHTKRVDAVAFARDGRRLASAGPDRIIRVWDLESAAPPLTLRAEASIAGLAFHPDGTTLAAGAVEVQLWDVATGRLKRKLGGPTGAVLAVAFSPDGALLASGGSDGIRLWNAATGALVRTLGQGQAVSSLAFAPDGRTLVAAQGDAIAVWDATGGRQVRTLTGHAGAVLSVAAAGGILVSGSADNSARVWDIAGGSFLRALSGHAGRFGWVQAVAVSPDGAMVASGGEDAAVKLWDAATGTPLRTLGVEAPRAEAVAFSADGRTVVVGGLGIDSEAQIWDLTAGNLVRTLRPEAAQSPSLSAEEERFAAESLEKSLHTTDKAEFDVRSVKLNFSGGVWGHGEAIRRILAGYPGTVRSIAFSPDGRRIVSGSLSRSIHVWDAETGAVLRRLTAHSGLVRAVAFSPDGTAFASGGEDGVVKIWDGARYHLRHKVAPAHQGVVLALAFGGGGRWLASAGEDKAVKVWDAATGAPLRTLATRHEDMPDLVAHTGFVYALAAHPDGRQLASAGDDQTVRIWDASAGKLLREVRLEGEWPLAVAFSPDGKTLAVGTYEGLVRLVDAASGAVQQTLTGHTGSVWSVAFEPRGRFVLSGSDDTTVRYWESTSGRLLATATASGSEWLVTTPEGLFDGSPGGWRGVRWRFSEGLLDTAPVEIFFNDFFQPGLLGEVLSDRPPAPPRSLAELDRRQPTVRLSMEGPRAGEVATRTVTLRLHVAEVPAGERSSGSGARDVRLFRNGSLVRVWRGAAAAGPPLEATVPIVAGPNRFSAYAFNRDNIKSADAELVVTGATSLRRPGVAYVLAIGINEYANPAFRLSYAVADAKAFADELRRVQQSMGHYERVEVIPLFDHAATRAGIVAALGRLARAQPEDAVFVYYAGHGTSSASRFYLIPHDLGYAGPREGLDRTRLQAVLSHSLSDADLERALEGVDAGRIVLVIDACHSGQALEAEERRRGPINAKGLAQLAYEKGMYVLTAAQGYQAALEAARLGHGYLTYALVEEALKTKAADLRPRDGELALREWLDYATLRVPQLQLASLADSREQGRELAFVEGEEAVPAADRRQLQRPRVYYRREVDAEPTPVARFAPDEQRPVP